MRNWGALIVAGLVVAGCAPKISGVYVAKTGDSIEMVQLVETPDHKITGRLETTSIKPNGDVANEVVTLEGAAARDEVTLLLKPVAFLSVGISATGQVKGNKLSLSGRDTSFSGSRSDLANYQHSLGDLRRRAAERQTRVRAQAAEAAAKTEAQLAVIKAGQDRERAEALDKLTDGIVDGASKLSAAADQMPDYAAAFASNTDNMRALAPNQFAQGKLLFDDTAKRHSEFIAFVRQFNDATNQFKPLTSMLETACAQTGQGENVSAACIRDLKRLSDVRAAYAKHGQKFEAIEASFNENLEEQQAMGRSFRR